MGDLAKSRATRRLREAIDERVEQADDNAVEQNDPLRSELVEGFIQHVDDPAVFDNVTEELLD